MPTIAEPVQTGKLNIGGAPSWVGAFPCREESSKREHGLLSGACPLPLTAMDVTGFLALYLRTSFTRQLRHSSKVSSAVLLGAS
jgi:hypothetical protein